ncbi:hypothetical protein OAS39_07120 [Pirellulales bacterium]|nr:hypothetical protein [Pirellulales bacterium]
MFSHAAGNAADNVAGRSSWQRAWPYHMEAWAAHGDQTSERLRRAIALLRDCYDYFPHPRESVLADRQLLRDVLQEKTSPSFMEGEVRPVSGYLALLANALPWERELTLPK